MDKKKLLESLYSAKEVYDNTVLNKNFLYIFKNSLNQKIEFIESTNLSSNFLHLTGVVTSKSGKDFYKLLHKKKLSLNDISRREDGWTDVKLNIFHKLPILFNSSIQLGLHDNMYTIAFEADILVNKPVLDREDIVLGLKKNSNNDYYAPSSIIRKKPQLISKNFSRVLFVLSKDINDSKYSNITYNAKGCDLDEILKRSKNTVLKEKIL